MVFYSLLTQDKDMVNVKMGIETIRNGPLPVLLNRDGFQNWFFALILSSITLSIGPVNTASLQLLLLLSGFSN